MTQPLLEHLPALAARIADAPHVLLGFDFDGTLTPIVSEPSQVKLDVGVRRMLRMAAERPRTSVAVVSGRSLADVKRHVGVPELIYVGNHGLELAGPDFAFVEPTAVRYSIDLVPLLPILRESLANIGGVLIEDKELTIAIHHRNVAVGEKERVFQLVQGIVSALPGSYKIALGKEVFEIRPRASWHKGTAVAWIARRLATPRVLTIYFGDDQTDEEAFKTLDDAVTVHVGNVATSARFHVAGPADVGYYLRWLIDSTDFKLPPSGCAAL